MQIILVTRRHGKSIHLPRWFGQIVPYLSIALAGLIFIGGYSLGQGPGGSPVDDRAVARWEADLAAQNERLRVVEQETREELAALTVRLAELQARSSRLDALGERLVDVADLDAEEFDFSRAPGMGGPELEVPPSQPGSERFSEQLDALENQLISRRQQLSVMQDLLQNRQLDNETFIAGRPVGSGTWMSSRYGYRTDPFTGSRSWHGGLDFAGRIGADVVAVAAGVVEFAGVNGGFGNVVEINHGDGYKTLYAHNQDLLVTAGEVVEKGQQIATLGSSGRSTGPHVHFEVHRNGRTLDPIDFITRRQ